jgi:dinuclear metal center YbgI/SA1388 family protein
MSASPDEFYAALKTIAPLELAAEWDNTGLLIEGPPKKTIAQIMVCIDLTHPVIDEAIAVKADTIVAYHPPIFSGVKRLTRRKSGQNLLIRLIEAGITVWSPHTALDAAPDGLADWLLNSVGDTTERAPIEPCAARPDDVNVGMGRQGRLSTPTSLDVLIPKLKTYLGLAHLRVATAARHLDGAPIKRVAVCPGAGGSLFSQVRFADLLLTGEMRHHDVLNRVANGTSVILTDHTNTERGYLPILAGRIQEALSVPVMVSAIDQDPLQIV